MNNMETRKKNKRRISFSSSSSSEESEAPAKPMPRITIKQIRPETPLSESDNSSVLSEAQSIDNDMTMLDDEDDADDAADAEEDHSSDEDEAAIIQSILQPQIDTSKKTARQKAKETGAVDHLEFLPTDRMSKNKPILTEEELALKKSENARKRKNQTEKKLDEEKQETINRLLNKQAGKRKGAVKQLTAADTAGLEDAEEAAQAQALVRKTRPVPVGMIRYVSNKDGAMVGVPKELIGHVVTRQSFG